jgi:peptide/nickel transport system substrate-binding protein
MDRDQRRRLEAYRRDSAGPVENTLVDEAFAGEMSRAAFIQRASLLGLSSATMAAVLGALGDAPLAFGGTRIRTRGGRIRVAIVPAPTAAIEPHMFADVGGLQTGGIAGEFLTRASQSLALQPELAISWKPNRNATVWTFKLRPSVKFQTGQPLTARDVVATFKRLVDPASGSQALSAFQGVLSVDGVQMVDDLTVAFHLDSPTASFPYLTSSTTYQAIILPASYKTGTFTTQPQTTGAFKLTSYTPGVGARYDRFDGWWGGSASLDGVDVTYFNDAAAVDAALLGGQVDLVGAVSVATDRPLLKNSAVKIFAARGTTHTEIPMRVDRAPFTDRRVRQAIALTLDRPAVAKTLFSGFADIGNDSPFAPVFPSTDKGVPQRHKDIRRARQLLAAAGHGTGLSIHATAINYQEVPLLAQILQRSLRPIGIKLGLTIQSPTTYFGGKPSTTPWLNAPMTLTGWSSRAIPNVFLTSSLKTRGIWNAAHYSSKRFDRLADSYIQAIALKDQRKYARQLELLLLEDTPVIFPYFFNYLMAGTPRVTGFKADALGQIYLGRTSLG